MEDLVLKSERTSTKACVRFVNKTNRKIDVIWVNFNGGYMRYATLNLNQFIDINTFINHPWLFLDSATRDRMRVRQQDVFYAQPSFNAQGAITRVGVAIHLPLHSLKMCTLLTVRNCLRNMEDIEPLDIPQVLKKDLQLAFDKQDIHIYQLPTRS